MSNVYWVLTGPTAAGKTASLIKHAATQPIVAISADSRQVYRHMDIGTGTPTTDETRLLSHKIINVVAPLDGFNAHSFLSHAANALRDAQLAGREPWIIGGTGLYIRALVDNLDLGSPPRPKLRAAIEGMFATAKSEDVARLLDIDTPDNENPVRVARAIENKCNDCIDPVSIYYLAGLGDIDFNADNQQNGNEVDRKIQKEISKWHCGGLIVIDPGKEELLSLIQIRVEGMFRTGLVNEVENLRQLGYGEAKVVMEGIGYREAGAMLDGQMTQEQAIEGTVIRTRQYAKKQRTYFKNMGWNLIHPSEFEKWFACRNA